jgi:hypothetical protein
MIERRRRFFVRALFTTGFKTEVTIKR